MHEPIAPEELEKWTRWFAIECNNRAWQLAESARRTGAEDEEMSHCAHAADAAGEFALHAKQYEIASALGTALPDPEERAIFEATFRVIPPP